MLERHPRLRLILAHSGGTLPFLAGRLDACTRVDENARRNLRKPFSEYLRMMYYDGVAYHAPAVRCALDLVGPERIMFGTDHPFGIADAEACSGAIRQVAATNSETPPRCWAPTQRGSSSNRRPEGTLFNSSMLRTDDTLPTQETDRDELKPDKNVSTSVWHVPRRMRLLRNAVLR